jgi:hypothetical protein
MNFGIGLTTCFSERTIGCRQKTLIVLLVLNHGIIKLRITAVILVVGLPRSFLTQMIGELGADAL